MRCTVAILCVALLATEQLPLLARQDEQAAPDTPLLSPEQLDSLISPIALYADPLVAQVLAAATYPLEVVEANRWLQANSGLMGTALTDAAQNQNWDPSVQALVVFPSVLQMMDQNLKWTTDLGNAFLAQEEDVMDAVQRQRQSAANAGKLVSSAQEKVETTTEDNKPVIVIQPTQPEVIYVPVYNPISIWGPPFYHPWPNFWYPPRPAGAIISGGIFSFWIGFPVARYFRHWGGWSSWGWGCGWRTRGLVINNNFYIRNNYRVPNNVYRNGVSRWTHNPQHRVGVPYSNRAVAKRMGRPMPSGRPANRPGAGARPPGRPSPETRPATRPTTRPSPGTQPSTRPAVRPDRSRDRTALGNIGNGDRARIESDRGYSSLRNKVPNARPAPAAKPAPPKDRPAPEARPADRPSGGQPRPAKGKR